MRSAARPRAEAARELAATSSSRGASPPRVSSRSTGPWSGSGTGSSGGVRSAAPAAIGALALGGRVVVITFHSLEDRIVKQALAAEAVDRTPPEFPLPVPELGPVLRLLTRGGEAPSAAELAVNPRAASARIRAAERIRRAA